VLASVSMKRGLKGSADGRCWRDAVHTSRWKEDWKYQFSWKSLRILRGLDEKRIERDWMKRQLERYKALSRWKEDWKFNSSLSPIISYPSVSMKRGLKDLYPEEAVDRRNYVSMKRGLKAIEIPVNRVQVFLGLDEKRIESSTLGIKLSHELPCLDEKRIESFPVKPQKNAATQTSRWKEDWKRDRVHIHTSIWGVVSMKRGLKEDEDIEILKAIKRRLDEKRIESFFYLIVMWLYENWSRWKEDWKLVMLVTW